MALNWLATRELLSPAALTVRAQTISPSDAGSLIWPTLFPRVDEDSVDLEDVTTLDTRFVSDRREWNARGRRIPLVTPDRRKVSIVPVEGNDKIDEYEMQKLRERTSGNDAILQDIIGARIPQRVDKLTLANFRRLEVDAMNAWALGQITQRMPEDASKTYVASFGFAVGRYVTAGTAWNDASVNAYDLFLAFIASAQDLVGQVEGAMMRQATLNAILADAPDLPNGVAMTRSQLNDRISDDLAIPFTIFVNENSVDPFDDGGTAVTRTKLWPAQRVAAIPVGEVLGRMAQAPVVRAMDIVSEVGAEAGIDVRGNTVYYEESNNGRELSIEVQINALPVPDEGKMYVSNVGV